MRNKRTRSIFDALFGMEDMFLYGLTLSNREESTSPRDDDEKYNKMETITDTPTHTVKKEAWTSLDGDTRYERISYTSKFNSGERPERKEDIRALLDKAVEEQDFEKAIELRDRLKKFEVK